jgi:hypothetical protein
MMKAMKGKDIEKMTKRMGKGAFKGFPGLGKGKLPKGFKFPGL